MLYSKTPIGYVEIPSWQEKELINLSNEELLIRAYEENKKICVSPAVYAMIEKRGLGRSLQYLINEMSGTSVGLNHLAIEYLNKL